jgi:hypothetical protein
VSHVVVFKEIMLTLLLKDQASIGREGSYHRVIFYEIRNAKF